MSFHSNINTHERKENPFIILLLPERYLSKRYISFRRQHPRIMLRHDVIHLLHQIQTLKCDMPAALLKIANSEQITFENLLMRVIAHKIHKPDGDIMPVIGNGIWEGCSQDSVCREMTATSQQARCLSRSQNIDSPEIG